jgi:hypothetical protein
MASIQIRWTYNIPENYIPTRLQETLRKTPLAQIPTITRKNVNKINTAKDTCTIHSQDLQGSTTHAAYNLFRGATMLTMHKHITTIEHKHQNQTAKILDKLSQPTQALLEVLDSIQPADSWAKDSK